MKPPFKTFTLVAKNDRLIKRKVTIAKRRYMPVGRQYTIELDTGWPGLSERTLYRGGSVKEFREIIKQFFDV